MDDFSEEFTHTKIYHLNSFSISSVTTLHSNKIKGFLTYEGIEIIIIIIITILYELLRPSDLKFKM